MYGTQIRFDQEPEAEASTHDDRRRHKSVSAIKVKFDDSSLLISDKFKAQLENNFNSLKMKGINDYQTAEKPKPAKTLSPQARGRYTNQRGSQNYPV